MTEINWHIIDTKVLPRLIENKKSASSVYHVNGSHVYKLVSVCLGQHGFRV